MTFILWFIKFSLFNQSNYGFLWVFLMVNNFRKTQWLLNYQSPVLLSAFVFFLKYPLNKMEC